MGQYVKPNEIVLIDLPTRALILPCRSTSTTQQTNYCTLKLTPKLIPVSTQ
jgi:hypothetical protein